MQQYKAKKACTLPGTHRYVEAGEVVTLDLPKGKKAPKHLEPIKPAPQPKTAPKQNDNQNQKKPAAGSEGQNQGADKNPDHSKPDDLKK